MLAVKDIYIPHNVLSLEDDPWILKDLNYRMQTALDEIYSTPLYIDSSLKNKRVLIKPCSIMTDNLADASKIIFAGKCNILIVDYKVKETSESKNFGTSCLFLLKEIKKKKVFLPVIVHSAFSDIMDIIKSQNLAIEIVSKEYVDSIDRIVEKAMAISVAITNYKKKLLEAFEEIKHASILISSIDRRTVLENAQNMFTNLEIPSWMPEDYSKACIKIGSILFRMIGVNNGLSSNNTLLLKLIKLLDPLINELCKPLFFLEQHAAPIFKKLESLEFNIFERINDEA